MRAGKGVCTCVCVCGGMALAGRGRGSGNPNPRPGAKHFPFCNSQEGFVVLVLPPAVAKIAHKLSKYKFFSFCLSLYFLYPKHWFHATQS